MASLAPLTLTTLRRPTISFQVLVTPVFLRSDRMQADLLRHLFSQYEKEQRPTTEGHTRVNVSIQTDLLDLDTLNRDFTLYGKLIATWRDPRLTWDARWEIPELAVPVSGLWPDLSTQMWRPVLRPRRAKEYLVDDTTLLVTQDGVVTMEQAFQLRAFCAFDYSDFPSDSQTCTFNVTAVTQYVSLYPGQQRAGRDFDQPSDFVALTWWLEADEPFTSSQREWPEYISLRFTLVRDVSAFLYPIIIPCCLISLVSVLMFVMHEMCVKDITLATHAAQGDTSF